ncbi:Site-specific tyrosine recombinase XerD, partial [Olavius sp. associated proteobacterium Delta 1]
MDLVVTITEYKQRLKSLGYAEATIESYSRDLDLFRRYLQDLNMADLRKVTHQVICDYQEKIMSEPVAMETRALKLRVVKRLFEYLCQTHRLLINPTEGIVETSRRNRKIGTVLTVAEVRRLLKQPNLSLRTGIRDRAMIEVLYSTGIRLDELVNLEVYHVDFKDKVLYIRKGKGKKQRVVPLGKNARKYLKEYLEKIRPWYGRKNPKERKLFLNQSGLAMTASNLRVNLRKYRNCAGIKKPVSPHTFRRSCATHLLQNGADIRYIQQLLGHRHLKTTQTYTKVMPVEVKQTHNKTHPGIRGPSFAARATEGKQKKDKS